MTEKQLQEIIEGLFDECKDCGGTGKDPEYNARYECYHCSGEGKKMSWFGQQLLEFLQKNIKIKIST